MFREQRRISASFDEMEFAMQSPDESDKWHRVFPDPMPPTHYLYYSWRNDGLRDVLTIKPVEISQVEPKVPSPPADTSGTTRIALVVPEEWKKLSDEQLEEMATEMGVHFPKRATREHRLAILAEARHQRSEGKKE